MRPLRRAFLANLDDLLASTFSEPRRPLGAAAVIASGVALLLITAGASSMSARDLRDDLDRLGGTRIVVSSAPAQPSETAPILRWDDDELFEEFGVIEAAAVLHLVNDDAGVSTARSWGRTTQATAAVFASNGPVDAVFAASMTSGRFFDAGHGERDSAVAVVGPGLAAQLGPEAGVGALIFIEDSPYTVLGVLADAGEEPRLFNAVLIPPTDEVITEAQRGPQQLHLRGLPGTVEAAAETVRSTLASVGVIDDVSIAAEPSLAEVTARVDAGIASNARVVGLVVLAAGVLSIGVAMSLAVNERRMEFGLRRALGASRLHIAALVAAEAALIGLAAGSFGSLLGAIGLVVLGWAEESPPILPSSWALFAPLGAAIICTFAGLHPAWRASAMEPAEAVRYKA